VGGLATISRASYPLPDAPSSRADQRGALASPGPQVVAKLDPVVAERGGSAEALVWLGPAGERPEPQRCPWSVDEVGPVAERLSEGDQGQPARAPGTGGLAGPGGLGGTDLLAPGCGLRHRRN
jgi:hypothetical protein